MAPKMLYNIRQLLQALLPLLSVLWSEPRFSRVGIFPPAALDLLSMQVILVWVEAHKDVGEASGVFKKLHRSPVLARTIIICVFKLVDFDTDDVASDVREGIRPPG